MTDAEPEKVVARPLKVLTALIKQDLDAAEKAGEAHYRAAGEKFLEAKRQLKHGQFMAWVKENFTITHRQATNYIALAEANQSGIQIPLSKINNQRREQKRKSDPKEQGPRPTINIDVAVKGKEERELLSEMALDLIDAGYNALAPKHDPDTGGSNESMTRLNAVRDWLNACAQQTGMPS